MSFLYRFGWCRRLLGGTWDLYFTAKGVSWYRRPTTPLHPVLRHLATEDYASIT